MTAIVVMWIGNHIEISSTKVRKCKCRYLCKIS